MASSSDIISNDQSSQALPSEFSLQSTSESPAKVLVVEPHPTLRTVLVQRLRQDGHLAAAVGCGEDDHPV